MKTIEETISWFSEYIRDKYSLTYPESEFTIKFQTESNSSLLFIITPMVFKNEDLNHWSGKGNSLPIPIAAFTYILNLRDPKYDDKITIVSQAEVEEWVDKNKHKYAKGGSK